MTRCFYNNVYYFITTPTVKHFPYFDSEEKKSIILKKMEKSQELFQLKDFDYSILSHHYHIISYFHKGEVIPKLLQMINGGSAYELNKLIENKRPIWGEYYIYVINDERLLARVRGYVVGNPLKHGEVKMLTDLEGYPFSSFYSLTQKFGKEQVISWVQSVILLDDVEFVKEFHKKTERNRPD
jgi:hypothetical protein